jgi:hypothetical protein
MEYVLTWCLVVYHHSSRSILTSEVPTASWIRGEHELGHHVDGYPRCIARCMLVLRCAASVWLLLSVVSGRIIPSLGDTVGPSPPEGVLYSLFFILLHAIRL